MDAGIVLTTPREPPSGAADPSSEVPREDAEAFAAHLPQETQSRPAPRKPAAQEKDEPVDEDEKIVAAPQLSFSLTSPIAPVLVRQDGAPAILDIALTPAPPAPTPQSPALVTPDAGAALAPPAPLTPNSVPAKEVAPQAGAPATPIAATPPLPLPEATALPASPQTAAPANPSGPINLSGAETLAAAVVTPVKAAPVEPATESLRNAGRPRGAKAEAQAGAEARPVSATTASAQSGARADAKPEFVAATTSAPAAASSDAAAQPGATGEAAAVSLEARRAAEAPPVAVHRPPTVAATVAQHIIRRFDGKSTSIDVRLDPAELGRVSVKLEVGPDSRVTAIVAADNPATLSDLMRSSRELERALESAGLELTQGGLSFDLSDRSAGNGAQANDAGPAGARAGNDNAVVSADATAPASRPFGLESWRGVRVDVTV